MSKGFVCLGVNIFSNQIQEHFFAHKMVLELQEEDMKLIIERRTKQDQFIVGFARPEEKLGKKAAQFFSSCDPFPSWPSVAKGTFAVSVN